ncbi:MAG: UDP-N-acetylmuramoyl-tripeptide--D-alanyl-D-alanine ligase [Prevotellaceae bacterium]|jgi:UDP-N-acetylmuramoyl-tripeptide--D-alanyl-D-alanine ligase|nr:UDP-N-acetylmuramoyl-tripeptide--D-alanyl-D-alanine ligase [Prevotellaceae bacterium]
MIEIINVLAVLCLFCYLVLVLKKELHMLQLNSYFNTRYAKWYKENFRSHCDIVKAAVVVVCVLLGCWDYWFLSAAGVLLSGVGIGTLGRQKAKKKLDFTKRAVRLFAMALLLSAAALVLTFAATQNIRQAAWPLAALIAFSFVAMLFANTLMQPLEAAINRWYVNDAKKKIKNYPNLTVVAITGSYGKTSVKHFLQSILSEQYSVLITPGSFNTTMGVVRTVREQLQPIHEVFVVEMGAKKAGDVAEICRIVRPQYGVITAVGAQHLETFGTVENVKKAKLEIISALPAAGTGFINAADIAPADLPADVKANVVSFGVEKGADYCARNIVYAGKGMSFDVYRSGEKLLTLETTLLGEHNVSNLLVCCAVALTLGLEKYKIEKAVKGIRAVAHRLEVKVLPNGVTVIDDAFNSNPVGSKMALEALKRMEGKRKIIITPGMIELGAEEAERNCAFGRAIAGNCDIAVLVGVHRTQPIQEGIQSAGFPVENMVVCKNLKEANDYVKSIMQPGDVVLYENDLPDTFNE